MMDCTIPTGYGYWDVSSHPVGGDFHRADANIHLTECREVEDYRKGRLIVGRDTNGRTLAVAAEYARKGSLQ